MMVSLIYPNFIVKVLRIANYSSKIHRLTLKRYEVANEKPRSANVRSLFFDKKYRSANVRNDTSR